MNDAIDLLESRIELLELQILPKNASIPIDPQENITNMFLQTQMMIGTALSRRETITSILQSVTSFNEFLDPTNGENEIEVEAKRYYLMEYCPDLRETIEKVANLRNSFPLSEDNQLLKIEKLSEKLENLAVYNLSVFEESKKVTDDVLKALKVYNDIANSLKLIFYRLDLTLSELEAALQPKLATEE